MCKQGPKLRIALGVRFFQRLGPCAKPAQKASDLKLWNLNEFFSELRLAWELLIDFVLTQTIMRHKASDRILERPNEPQTERHVMEEPDIRWVFLGMKVMDELKLLARLARPAAKH